MKHLKNKVFSGYCRIIPILSGILLFCTCNILVAQETSSGKMRVYPSIGIAAGFFNPGDVNDYIAASAGNISTTFGTTDMFVNYEIKGGVTFRLKHVDFSGDLAYGIAPKWIIVTNGSNMNYYFTRISPGMSANYYIPMKSKRMEFFMGGGVQYHFMKFESLKASSPGFCLRAGVSMQFGRFNMQPYVSFLYAKSEDTYLDYLGEKSFEMNYTSGIIGIIMSFHPPIDRN
jgi:hypothetical protein